MFKIDTGDATSTEPSRPAAGTVKFFSKALKTIVPDWWLNMLQNEVYNVVDEVLTPDKTDDTQLLQAINAINKSLMKTTENPFINYALLKRNLTTGGTPAQAGWANMLLEESVNGITGVSVLGGIVTLPAGTYSFKGYGTHYSSNSSSRTGKLGLYNETAGSFEINGDYYYGSGGHGRDSTADKLHISGIFTLPAITQLSLQQWHTTGEASGRGYHVPAEGVPGDYTTICELEIWKLT